MSRKFSVLLVLLIIVFSSLGGFIAGRLFTRMFARKIVIAEEAKRSKILTVGGLNIVDKNGKLLIKLGREAGADGHGLYIYGQKGSMSISTNQRGADINILEGLSNVIISSKLIALQNVNFGRAEMKVSENEGARIVVGGKGSKGRAEMSVNEYGGNLAVYDKVDNKARVVIGIDKHGYGDVSLLNEAGYRLK